ncbi:MAG: hypothetical protein H0X18_14310 [Geodermatophilaceae bacterium]|nr:hypothetical protein [Geodermatophilaceae bacterium]
MSHGDAQPITDSQALLEPDHAPTTAATVVQRHEVLDWLGPVDLYADRSQRLEIADATWLAILERVTGP